MTVASWITISRIIFTICCGIMYYNGNVKFAFFIFAFACLSDFLDGFIARKYNMISDVGKLLDPLADKIAIFVGVWCLVSSGTIGNIWLVAIAIIEALFIVGGLHFFIKGIVVHSKNFGKAASVFFFCGISFGFLGYKQMAVSFLFSAMVFIVLGMGYYLIYFGK